MRAIYPSIKKKVFEKVAFMKIIIKKLILYLSLVVSIPIWVARPIFYFSKYLFRACYTQYKRFELKNSHSSLVISYPTHIDGGKYICCGKNVFLGPGGILSAWSNYQGVNYSPEIRIGDNVTIGNGYHISSACRISIGNNVLMGKYITIVDNSHGKTTREVMDISPIKRELLILGEVVIDDNVWIADKVTISKGVKIGRGAIIGANSVVTADVPPYSVVVGSPAKVIKQY